MSEDHYLTKALKLNWKPYVPALRLRPFVLPLQFASFQFRKSFVLVLWTHSSQATSVSLNGGLIILLKSSIEEFVSENYARNAEGRSKLDLQRFRQIHKLSLEG